MNTSPPTVSVSMIAAVAENRVIGVDGAMPWHIPSDFAHFRRMTMGKPMIMGRKQFETLGRALPGRVNIVVSRQAGYQPEGVIVLNDFDAALDHAKAIAQADNAKQVMIIGGGEIYDLGMKRASKLYISHVNLRVEEPEGVPIVRFPIISKEMWRVEKELPVEANPKDQAGYSIKVYARNDSQAH